MPSGAAGSAAAPGLPSAASSDLEKQAALDARLAESLGQFDDMLLKEKKVLEQSKRPADSGSSSGAQGGSGGGFGAGSAGSAGAEGGPAGSSGQSAGAQGSGGAESGEAAAEGSSGQDSSQGGAVGSGSGRGPESEESPSTTPSDVGDGHDDDVVARQLREAAENERDPELRERLWDEYRAYKSGRRAPARSSSGASQGDDQEKNGGES